MVDRKRQIAERQRGRRRAGARAVIAVKNENRVREIRLLARRLEKDSERVIQKTEAVVLLVTFESVRLEHSFRYMSKGEAMCPARNRVRPMVAGRLHDRKERSAFRSKDIVRGQQQIL